MKGIDVNGKKGAVNWARVRADGYEFAFLKATEGKTFDDERFAFNRRAAKAAGLVVGAYHFARPDNNSPAEEAAHFLRVYQVQHGEVLPILDWETPPAKADWALQFLRIVERAIGTPPILYTFPDFLRQTGSFEALSHYPLWYASYGPNDGNAHAAQPPSGFRFAVHQFTSKGSVQGVSGDADLNVLKLGSLDSLVVKADESWKGPFDLFAGNRRVAVGNLRDDAGHVTEEAATWIRAVREGGGGGRVAPHRETRDVPGEALGDTEAETEASVEPPQNPEGDGAAGQWAQGDDRESREREDFG